jgi:hypothetical protein
MRYVPEFTKTEKQRKYYYKKGLPQALLSNSEEANQHSCSHGDRSEAGAVEREALRNEKRKLPQPNLQLSSSQRLRVGDRKLPGPLPQ